MKSYITIGLALTLILVTAGCSPKTNNGSSGSTSTPPISSSSSLIAVETPAAKLGMATLTSLGSSKGTTAENGPKAQADTSICSLTLDGSNKILSVNFDTIEAKINFDTKGALTTDIKEAVKSKKELGDSYGMKKVSPIGKEWYEQIAALEKYMVGKPVDEVIKLKLKKVDEAHPSVPDIPELTSSCTINVGDYVKLVDMAAKNAK